MNLIYFNKLIKYNKNNKKIILIITNQMITLFMMIFKIKLIQNNKNNKSNIKIYNMSFKTLLF